MKLFYSPGACSLAVHISLLEAGIPFGLEKVSFSNSTYGNGQSFLAVNPKGYVPAIQLDDGSVLTEGIAIQGWIADQKPELNLLPKAGTTAYYKALEWLAFISTELHKGFAPLFDKETPDDMRKKSIASLMNRFAHVDNHLKDKMYLLGNDYSSADAYLFTVFHWPSFIALDVTRFSNIAAHRERMLARPAVRKAIEAERLKL